MGELLRYPLSLSPDASTVRPLPLRFLYAPSHTSFHIRNLSVYLRIPCPFIHKKGGNAIVSPRDSFNQCTSLRWVRLIEVFASVFNPLRYCGVMIGTPSSRAYSMKWLRYTIVFILVSSSSGTITAWCMCCYGLSPMTQKPVQPFACVTAHCYGFNIEDKKSQFCLSDFPSNYPLLNYDGNRYFKKGEWFIEQTKEVH